MLLEKYQIHSAIAHAPPKTFPPRSWKSRFWCQPWTLPRTQSVRTPRLVCKYTQLSIPMQPSRQRRRLEDPQPPLLTQGVLSIVAQLVDIHALVITSTANGTNHAKQTWEKTKGQHVKKCHVCAALCKLEKIEDRCTHSGFKSCDEQPNMHVPVCIGCEDCVPTCESCGLACIDGCQCYVCYASFHGDGGCGYEHEEDLICLGCAHENIGNCDDSD